MDHVPRNISSNARFETGSNAWALFRLFGKAIFLDQMLSNASKNHPQAFDLAKVQAALDGPR